MVRSMYNFVNCLQFNIRYEKVERPTPVGGALVIFTLMNMGFWKIWANSITSTCFGLVTCRYY